MDKSEHTTLALAVKKVCTVSKRAPELPWSKRGIKGQHDRRK